MMSWRRNCSDGYPVSEGFFIITVKILLLVMLFNLSGFVPAWAAGDGGEGSFADFGWRVVNFAILAGLLFYLGANKIRSFFDDRKAGVFNALKEAQKARDNAESRYQEALAKLAAADEEIAGLSRLIEAQGRSEREKILSEANDMAQRVKADTTARMEQEFVRLRQQLQQEAVSLAIDLAEKLLREKITLADRERMIFEYLVSLRQEDRKNARYSQVNML